MPYYNSQGFETNNSLALGTYPAPRLKRSGPEPSGGANPNGDPNVGRQFPRGRTIAYAIQIGIANRRCSTSLGPLHGPCVIRGLHVGKTGAALGLTGIGLGYAPNAVTETDVAFTVPLPFTPLFDGAVKVNLPPTGENFSDVMMDLGTVNTFDDDSLFLTIMDKDFFLVIYGTSASGTTPSVVGHVNLIERCDPQALALMVG